MAATGHAARRCGGRGRDGLGACHAHCCNLRRRQRQQQCRRPAPGGNGTAKARTAARRVTVRWLRWRRGGAPFHPCHLSGCCSPTVAKIRQSRPRRRTRGNATAARAAPTAEMTRRAVACLGPTAWARVGGNSCRLRPRGRSVPAGPRQQRPTQHEQHHHCRKARVRHAAPPFRPYPPPTPPAARRLPPSPRLHRRRRANAADPPLSSTSAAANTIRDSASAARIRSVRRPPVAPAWPLRRQAASSCRARQAEPR